MKRYAVSTEDPAAELYPLVMDVQIVARDFLALLHMLGTETDGWCYAEKAPARAVELLRNDVMETVKCAEQYASAFAKRFEPIRSRSTQIPPGKDPGEGAAGCAADASTSPEGNGPENDGADGPCPGPDAVK